MQKKEKSMNAFLRIIKTIKGKKKFLISLLFIQVIQAILTVGYALFFRSIIDCAVEGNRNGVIYYVVGFALLALTQLILRTVAHFLNEFTRSGIENIFKKHLFSNILKKDFSAVTAVHSGEWLNRLTNDTLVVADGITNIIPGVCATVIRMVCAFIFLSVFIPKFALFLALIGVILVFVTVLFRKISKKLHVAIQKADGDLRVFLTEQLNALMMVKAYGKEDTCAEIADDYMAIHRRKRMNRNHFMNFSSSGFSFVMNAIRVLAALYSGFAILNGVISYGTFTAIIQLLGQVQGPIASISGYAPKFYAMLASAERIFEAAELESESEDGTPFDANEFYKNSLLSFGLKDADFSYESGENNAKIVLKKVDFSVNKGEFIAFVGRSGCGKSTVLKVFLSLLKLDNGECFISSNKGKIILDSNYRKLFAYVPQGNVLMNARICDVVSFFDKNINEEAVLNALKVACADEFVARLSDGIYTHLGERGAGLSEGEMQRIAIARAIYSGRPILLLDEATSALDAATEEALLRNIKTMTDKTVVIVTHRPKALSFVDKTINFED